VDSETLWSLVFTWAPVLLMVAFWLYFMRRFMPGGRGNYFDRHIDVMERQAQILERIAIALERRNG